MENKVIYPAIFEFRQEGYIFVFFPDLGIFTIGDNGVDAFENAKQALGNGLLEMIDEKEPINKPAELKKVVEDIGVTNSKTIMLIEVNLDDFRKKNPATIDFEVKVPRS